LVRNISTTNYRVKKYIRSRKNEKKAPATHQTVIRGMFDTLSTTIYVKYT
jgi:hypothetical protein